MLFDRDRSIDLYIRSSRWKCQFELFIGSERSVLISFKGYELLKLSRIPYLCRTACFKRYMKVDSIAIGSDHAGYELKEELKAYLTEKGFRVQDEGTYSEVRADYPDHAHAVARAVQEGTVDMGCIMCGSGNGINMSANKFRSVRSALCWCEEIVRLARQHNDANVLALPARFIHPSHARHLLELFLTTEFEGGRHQKRVEGIDPDPANVG